MNHVIAQTLTDDEKKYVGRYSQQTNETVAQLYLFENKQFCYTFMGGSLDLLVAGNWMKQDDGIFLKEKRSLNQPFFVLAKKIPKLKDKVRIYFDGRSMSEATRPVFAVSEDDATPKSLKSLFLETQSSWKSEYVLPDMPLSRVKYMYIGFVEQDVHHKAQRLKVYQYKIENANEIRIGYNPDFLRPLMDTKAVLKDKTLNLGGRIFGNQDLVTHQTLEEARTACFETIQDSNTVPQNALTTTKTISLETHVISQGHHEFVPDESDSGVYTSWNNLESEFKKALNDNTYLPNYVKFANHLMDRQENLQKHLNTVIYYSNELINKFAGSGNRQSAGIAIKHFIDDVYPSAIPYLNDKEIQKGVNILTSNALGTAIALKHDDLRKKIYAEVLGADFDIQKIEHTGLLYNLACDYALHKEKNKMLQAIKLAIGKGKNPQSFKQDSDFSAYYADTDFLKIVSP